MVLSPEQHERIRVNRERAYEIQRQRRLEKANQEEKETTSAQSVAGAATEVVTSKKRSESRESKDSGNGQTTLGLQHQQQQQQQHKRPKTASDSKQAVKNGANEVVAKDGEPKREEEEGKEDGEQDDVLEAFEETASPWVTKGEAKKMYCLPEGTLAVCEYIEKPNPHNRGWTPMKMYKRNEIRRRARKRYGGLDGLIAERRRREDKRFAKDMQRSQEIFSTQTKK